MMELTANDKLTLSAIGGLFGSALETFIGVWCYHITILMSLMCIDFVMGIMTAVIWGRSPKSKSGKLSSDACWKGLVKKVCTLFIVAAAYQTDRLLGMDFVRTAVVIAFCISELLSILENAAIMGILPESVKMIFDKAIEFIGKENDKNDGNK